MIFAKLRFPHFQYNRSQTAVRLSAIRAGRTLPAERSTFANFCQKLSKPQGYGEAGAIIEIEEINYFIGTRIHDLLAFSVAPQRSTNEPSHQSKRCI
jgi:hypothetical protein